MNGGMHDGINLAGKLAKVIHGEAGEELLDLYSRQRRHAAVKYVQAQTIANKRLMEERDPAVRQGQFRRTAPHRRQQGHRAGLYAPRRAVRQPARRRRGDLTGHLGATCATAAAGPHPASRDPDLPDRRTDPSRRPCVGRVRGRLVQSDGAARHHRAVARRQDGVHHRAGAWPDAGRALPGVRAAGERAHRRACGLRRSRTTRCRASTTRATPARWWTNGAGRSRRARSASFAC